MSMVVSFLGAQFKSKHLRENDLNSYLENFLNGKSPHGLKHVIITFYLPHIFQYIPSKMLSNISVSRKNWPLLSTKWAKLTPKISNIFGSGTRTKMGKPWLGSERPEQNFHKSIISIIFQILHG